MIGGVYPHLTTYAHNDPQGVYKTGSECGIGAVVPWAGKLWMINYAAHKPNGSDHKLYSVDADMKVTVHPESVGGTPAGRMIHRETEQLLIGPYLISKEGKVRVISPQVMPGRITAIARHLTDPARKVYYYMMEGELWEADLDTLEVKELYHNPLPGWHGKGGYTSQGRLVVSNNGEAGEKQNLWQVTDLVHAPGDPKAGSLAQWDGQTWELLERYQFADVTGPGGLHGAPDEQSPLWAIGWDKRSLRLKLLDNGVWHTYRLPKATHNNDPAHGWFTEWPRIREVGQGRAIMDMHGMFFHFPLSFSRANASGIHPIGSHLRYIPDFCDWNGRLVLATDETSIQGNPLGGQPQSNLWFGTYDELKEWGPRSAYGGPWVNDAVKADVPSEPFHLKGYPRRLLYVSHGQPRNLEGDALSGALKRTTNAYAMVSLAAEMAGLPMVTVPRGNLGEPGAGFEFTIDKPSKVYLLADARAVPPLSGWTQTALVTRWSKYTDVVFVKHFEAGKVEIPANTGKVTGENYAVPHAVLVGGASATIEPLGTASLTAQPLVLDDNAMALAARPLGLTLEVDVSGNNKWEVYKKLEIPARSLAAVEIPSGLDAEWIRLRPDRDVENVTAYFHYSEDTFRDASAYESIFEGIADIKHAGKVHAALIRPSPTRYDLNMIVRDVDGGRVGPETHVDLDRSFEFKSGEPDEELRRLLVKPTLDFSVDEASVVVRHNGVNYRLPKGDAAFDTFGESTFVRTAREVESERELANIHGTFYELPLIKVGAPPLIDKLRPVASHSRQIYDFMTWQGLLLMSGVRADAEDSPRILKADDQRTSLWAGSIDELWKLGKPVGRGGPWKDTAVDPDTPSDPYLMTGYDRKTLTLSSDRDVVVMIEIDIDHQTGWHTYKKIPVKGGSPVVYRFPEYFSAHWVRLTSDTRANMSATFVYE